MRTEGAGGAGCGSSAWAMSGRRALWLPLCVPAGELGPSFDMKLKAISTGSGRLFWEAGGVIEAFLRSQRRHRVEVSRELRKQKVDWEVWCLAFGVDYSEVVTLSLRQLRARGDDNVAEENCHDVLLSDFGLFFVLVMWSGVRRSHRCQDRARKILQALLERLVSDAFVTVAWVGAVLDDVSGACCEHVAGGRCTDLGAAFQLGGSFGTSIAGVASTLSSCVAVYLQCAACRSAILKMIRGLCAHIRSRVDDLPCMDGDALRHGVGQIVGSGRKRVDREFKSICGSRCSRRGGFVGGLQLLLFMASPRAVCGSGTSTISWPTAMLAGAKWLCGGAWYARRRTLPIWATPPARPFTTPCSTMARNWQCGYRRRRFAVGAVGEG